MSLIDDWKSYVESPSRFKMSHFEDLMSELETATDLHDAFDRLPGGFDFAENILKLRAGTDATGTYLLPTEQTPTPEDSISAIAYRDAVYDRLRELNDDEAQIVGSAPLVEISVEDYKKIDPSLFLNAPISISQDYIFYTSKHPKWIRGLFEAVYTLTNIPEVTRSLLSPIAKYPLNDEIAFNLWMRGHRMDFCEDRTLLITGGA